MNREQIEAWLILEGWEPRAPRGGNVRYLQGPVGSVWLHFDTGPAVMIARWPNKAGKLAKFTQWNDTELQLIYQEIIKHEKD